MIMGNHFKHFGKYAVVQGVFVMSLMPFWGYAAEKAIYGPDDRKEYFEVPKKVQQTADSVAALFYASALPYDGKAYQIPQTQYPFNYGNNHYPLCAKEHFAKQPSAAYCSGVLIAPNQVLTAAHCAKDQQGVSYGAGKSCAGIVLSFDYRLDAASKIPTNLTPNQLYQCQKVLDYFYQDNGQFQLVILQLDRYVKDRNPLPIRSSGKIADGTPIGLIGYPLGWPLKIAKTGATVRDNKAEDSFITDVDSFHGNSGSPVFDAEQLRQGNAVVEGILVSGEVDFILTEQACATANTCKTQKADEPGCNGEKVMRVNKLIRSRK